MLYQILLIIIIKSLAALAATDMIKNKMIVATYRLVASFSHGLMFCQLPVTLLTHFQCIDAG